MLYKDGEKYFTQAPEVVNNLTTGGTTKALSAEQGKVLKNTIDNLPQGGHTIKNDSGTSQTQRDNLQFGGVYTHDDSTNGKTQVDIIREFDTVAEIEALTGESAKGIQYVEGDADYIKFDAKDIQFDNTGTSYTSDDVDGVLKEVNTKLKGTVYTGDLNDLKATGMYGFTVASGTNAPTDIDVGIVCNITVNASGSLITQTLTVVYNSKSYVYIRRFLNNSWGNWIKYSAIYTKTVPITTNSTGVANLNTTDSQEHILSIFVQERIASVFWVGSGHANWIKLESWNNRSAVEETVSVTYTYI